MSTSPPAAPSPTTALLDVVRDEFGRVAYSHKNHEKMADRLNARVLLERRLNALLLVLTTGNSFLQTKKSELGIARDLDISDIYIEVIGLLANRVEAELGVAFFVAAYSALRKAPVSPALLILGDLSVQGNIKPLRSLTKPLQVAKDNGAKRALIPIENKRNFLDVSADIMERVAPIFFGDAKTAAMKVLGA